MRLFFGLLIGASLGLGSCQQEVVVGTPTSEPPAGYVEGPETRVPTSTNTVDAVPNRLIESDTTHRPAWLKARIATVLGQRKQYPIVRILRYEYKGQTVYWETAPCCDQRSTVFDAQGHVVCQPDGGITGKGDGRCADFDKNKTNEKLVWQDPR